MKFTQILALLAMVMMLALSSCDENTTDPVDDTLKKPAAPTAIMANSSEVNGEATISLKWTKSVSEGTADFANYELTILNAANAPVGNIITLAAGATSYTVASNLLTQGEIYKFELRAVNKDFDSDAATISWSPAWRFVEEPSTGFALELYGNKSDYGSGLDFYSDTDQGPIVVSVSKGSQWNIGFDDKDGLKIGSAGALSYNINPGLTEITATSVWDATNLDDLYFDKPLNQYSFSESTIDLSKYSSDIVFIARAETAAGSGKFNYVRVFVDYENGSFVRDAGTDNQYIVVYLSYQAEVDVPYAQIGQAK